MCPHQIFLINGTTFKKIKINNFLSHHGIDGKCPTIFYPKKNRLEKEFNKTLTQILKKTLTYYKKKWHE